MTSGEFALDGKPALRTKSTLLTTSGAGRFEPIHPGELLPADFLKTPGLSQCRLARSIGVTPQDRSTASAPPASGIEPGSGPCLGFHAEESPVAGVQVLVGHEGKGLAGGREVLAEHPEDIRHARRARGRVRLGQAVVPLSL